MIAHLVTSNSRSAKLHRYPCVSGPTCQTGGKVLADRRMSRLLK